MCYIVIDVVINVVYRYQSREWAEELWDKWFYEVLSEVRSALAEYEKGRRPVQWWLPDSTMNSKRKNKNKDTDGPSGTAPITLGGGGGGASSTVPASGATSVNISVVNLELTSIQSLPSIVDEVCIYYFIIVLALITCTCTFTCIHVHACIVINYFV